MTEREAAENVLEWVEEVLPELANGYPYMTAQHGALTDVQVDTASKRITPSDPAFPFSALQQRILRVFSVIVNLMVEHTDSDEAADAEETRTLQDFGARLEDSLLSDATLGQRVMMASPLIEFDYSLPFVQYPDGTRGRQMQVVVSVGEMADEEEDVFGS